MNIRLPKKFLNALLFYIGCCGLLIQGLGVLYFWLLQIPHPMLYWWSWPAPLVCMLWGIVPILQLQKEQVVEDPSLRA